MPTEKKVTIDPSDDLLDLFNLLCDEVLLAPRPMVRKSILGLKGTDGMVMAKKILIQDIFKIIAAKNLHFELKITYTTAIVQDIVEDKTQPPLPEETDLVRKMKRQHLEINDDLVGKKKEITVEVPKLFVPEANKIPDF